MPTTKKALDKLSIEELLAESNALAAERTAILARQREIAAELDRRAVAIEERRTEEARLLGQANRPRRQSVF